ncbi:AAA family ATPase [Streptomyces rubiginosohelvolus]|uniref:AAA family ATPase n=1 Tax=Streptomyces rubiginosohelvolus TaxID=67362 RepID=UPI0035D9CA72
MSNSPLGVTVLGTTAGSGKSMFVRAFATLRRQALLDVEIYKPLSLTLNPATEDSELDRSVLLMASAAGIREPRDRRCVGFVGTPHDNAVELRRLGDSSRSLPAGRLAEDAVDLTSLTEPDWEYVRSNVSDDLRRKTDYLICEGAGAAADAVSVEVSNAYLAVTAQRPVVLVAGARKGGWPASVVGTHSLLPHDAAQLVAGFVVNGAPDTPQTREMIRIVEEKTGWPCVGISPILSFYADLPSRGIDEPVFSGWEEEHLAVAKSLGASLEPNFLQDVIGVSV